jgi:DNA-binding XRE family transcriptional regulator
MITEPVKLDAFSQTLVNQLTFGSLLRCYRDDEGLTQQKLATLLGISKAQLCDYELGRKCPSLRKGLELAAKLNLEVSVVIQVLLQQQVNAMSQPFVVALKQG